jgi:hypothetical protein
VSTVEGRVKLIQAAKKLMMDWRQAQQEWRDDNSRQFDKKYMTPLELTVRAATSAMERMDTMLDSAQRDCADRTGFDS